MPGAQSLARELYGRLEEDWLLIADRSFYQVCDWADWCAAADSGAQLLWRVKADLALPVLEILPDGSYRSVLVNPKASFPLTAKKHPIIAGVMANITTKKNLNLERPPPQLPARRQASPPQLLPREKAQRHRHPAQRPGHHQLANLCKLRLAHNQIFG